MDTVELYDFFGGVFRGTHYGSVGVYRHVHGRTYAGERKGGVPHGHGEVTDSYGDKYSGQFADGQWHGHCERHHASGHVDYLLYERGYQAHFARVYPDGALVYDFQTCGDDHADFVALKAAAQQAGVRTCPLPASNASRRRRPNRDAHAVSVFALRSVLVPGVGPRLWACVCKCARVWVAV
jgi:hypothetical protein